MTNESSRLYKSFLNARVNLLFYFITLILSFFSRKVFLDSLGDDFIGLTGSLSSLLGFLNIAELGIGSAVAYTLYKPLFAQDQKKITDIVSVYGYLYRLVGVFILIAGVILAFFFPLIYPNTGFNIGIIYFAYISFLSSSLLSYFINYRQTLLSADQKHYVVTACYQSAIIVKTLIQMCIAYYTHNYYVWSAIEIVCGVLYALILNKKIKQVYPWLKTDIRSGRLLRKQYPEIIEKVKQIFVHKIGGVIYSQCVPVLLYAFGSLQLVAFYGNYTLITNRLSGLLNSLLGSTAASIGNLIAEGDKEKIINVYWELLAIRFWIAGVFSFALYHLLPSFVILWLGEEYLLGNNILILIIITFVFAIIRNVTDQYKAGYGLYADVWAPLVESFISIVVAVICGKAWGLSGVLLGGITSTVLIVYIWHPYYLFSKGLCVSFGQYIFNFLKNSFVLICCYYISSKIIQHIPFDGSESWMKWIIYATCIVSIFSVVSLFIMLLFVPGIRMFIKRLKLIRL